MIAVFCTKADGINLDDRFGRCDHFTIVDVDSGKTIKTIGNSAKNSSDSAGLKAAQIILDIDADILIAPLLGPKAHGAILPFPIEIYNQGISKTISEILKNYKLGKLSLMTNPKVEGLHKV